MNNSKKIAPCEFPVKKGPSKFPSIYRSLSCFMTKPNNTSQPLISGACKTALAVKPIPIDHLATINISVD